MLIQNTAVVGGGSADTSKLPAEGRQSNGNFSHRTSGFKGAFVLSVLNRLDDCGVNDYWNDQGRPSRQKHKLEKITFRQFSGQTISGVSLSLSQNRLVRAASRNSFVLPSPPRSINPAPGSSWALSASAGIPAQAIALQ
jgi:hypothetical protein